MQTAWVYIRLKDKVKNNIVREEQLTTLLSTSLNVKRCIIQLVYLKLLVVSIVIVT